MTTPSRKIVPDLAQVAEPSVPEEPIAETAAIAVKKPGHKIG
jgi:hypothetical protein